MRRLSQLGVGHVIGLLVVAIVAVVGFTGYKVYSTSQKKADHPVAAQKASAPPETGIAQPQSVELKAADATLTQADQDLETSLDTSALDEDINALL